MRTTMNHKFLLEKYYEKYLSDVRKLSASSVGHYTQALRTISRFLITDGKVAESIYEVTDLDDLEVIKAYLDSNPEFIALDKRGHNMYSAGFNNYFRFATGEDFKNIGGSLNLLDVEAPVTDLTTREIKVRKRSSIIKTQVLEAADFKCEINSAHDTFVAKSTGHQYMEGHHVIPIHKQAFFNTSLDVYANVICLCPTCHRLLHYGRDNDRSKLLNQIYYERSIRLANSGIKITRDTFLNIVL